MNRCRLAYHFHASPDTTFLRRNKAGELILAMCVVLMTAWLTATVVGFLASGMASAIVR